MTESLIAAIARRPHRLSVPSPFSLFCKTPSRRQRSMPPKLAPAPTQSRNFSSPPARAFFQNMLDRLYVQSTGSANRVARALILQDPPSIDHGEITDKGSINQRAVLLHHAALVEALYEGADPTIILPRKYSPSWQAQVSTPVSTICG